MNIGLNGIGFVAGGMGGVETYFRELVKYLPLLDSEERFMLLCNDSDKATFRMAARMQPEVINLPYRSFKWYVRGIVRNTLAVDILNPAIYRLELNVIHHPFSLLSPTCPKIPSVVTVHDLQHEFYPQFFSKLELLYRKKNYRHAAERSARLIAISEFTKKCLVERYGIAASKIDVIHNGCGENYHVIADHERLQEVKSKYSLGRPFMLFPAATWPHKNHRNLLQALKLLKDQHNFDGELVLTGIAMPSHTMILAEVERLGISGLVRVLGYVPGDDLPCLYNLARLLVFPSLFEGFGIPLVEAMACGCPVVCSNITSMPEVVGDAGVMFDALSPEDMAGKVWSVWHDDGMRENLRRRGLARVSFFDWRHVAESTLEAYRKAVA